MEMMKKPDETQIGRSLIYIGLFIAIFYFIFGPISVRDFLYPDRPNLIVVESFTNEQTWSVTPAVFDPIYCDIKNETNSNQFSPIPLSISIKNDGEKSIEVTRLEMKYQPSIKVYEFDEDDKNTIITRKIIQSNEPTHKIHDLGTINPGELVEIKATDLLFFENLINYSINVTTKDDNSASAIISVILTYSIDYIIYTKNNEPIQGIFNITVGNKDYFINNAIPFTEYKWMENCTLQAEYKKILRRDD